jgi:mRNA interferase YafQ
MKKVIFSNKFTKDYGLMHKRGKDLNKVKQIIELLKCNKSMPIKYKDHKLTGSYKGSRELHIEPDWLLIYRINDQSIL